MHEPILRRVQIPRLAALARDDTACHPERSGSATHPRHPERSAQRYTPVSSRAERAARSRGTCTCHPERSRGICTHPRRRCPCIRSIRLMQSGPPFSIPAWRFGATAAVMASVDLTPAPEQPMVARCRHSHHAANYNVSQPTRVRSDRCRRLRADLGVALAGPHARLVPRREVRHVGALQATVPARAGRLVRPAGSGLTTA